MKYIDIKSGFKVKRVTSSDAKWHKLYDGFIEMCKQSGIYNENPSDADKYCVCGIGDGLADKICEIFFSKTYNKTEEEKNIISAAGFDIKEHVPEYIINEFNSLYELMYTFGCAPQRVHNSFV